MFGFFVLFWHPCSPTYRFTGNVKIEPISAVTATEPIGAMGFEFSQNDPPGQMEQGTVEFFLPLFHVCLCSSGGFLPFFCTVLESSTGYFGFAFHRFLQMFHNASKKLKTPIFTLEQTLQEMDKTQVLVCGQET